MPIPFIKRIKTIKYKNSNSQPDEDKEKELIIKINDIIKMSTTLSPILE